MGALFAVSVFFLMMWLIWAILEGMFGDDQ
jgi:hypothetical protein